MQNKMVKELKGCYLVLMAIIIFRLVLCIILFAMEVKFYYYFITSDFLISILWLIFWLVGYLLTKKEHIGAGIISLITGILMVLNYKKIVSIFIGILLLVASFLYFKSLKKDNKKKLKKEMNKWKNL